MDVGLSLALGTIAAGVALAESVIAGRGAFWTRLGVELACLSVLSTVLAERVGSPFAPAFLSGSAPQRLVEQVLAVAWWGMAARVAVTLARLLVTHEARPRESRIVSDLLAAVIYVAAALGVVAFVFGIPVRGLLATSGVIAIVLGLALQNTLGDLFSGIAVGVERPYRTGDLLAIDGGVSGRVVQVNWRSTHIKVGQDVAIVPNSVVAKSRLVNRSAPTPVSGDTLEVRVHPGVPPGRVLPVLEAALLSCEHLAPDTVPTAECSGLAGDGTTYALHFAAASADRVGAVRSEVLAQVHRHLFHAGMPLAVTGVVPAGGWRPRLIPADELLARSDLFGAIGDEHRAVLAAQLVAVELRAGEVLFREGDEATALCLIASGTMEVTVGDPERPVRRHRLAPGETIGTVALVTGKPHTATATARNAVRAFRLDAAGLAAALGEAPGLAEELEDTVSRVLAIMARFDAGEAPVEAAHHGALIGRLRAFLGGLR